MILHSLKATNFKKFRDIDLRDLPKHGLVGIVGPNEGGKSTVIDAISFALFGATEATPQAGLESVIHWEEDVCQVEIVWEVPDGRIFRLFREIDRMGDHLAQLEEVGHQPSAPGTRAALTLGGGPEGLRVSGPVRVARAIKKILGYSYDDFRHSFYLAQHAGDALSAQSAGAPDWSGVLFRMTGIATMDRSIAKAEGVVDSIKSEVRQVEDELVVQGRVLGAMGVTADDEEALRGDLEEIGRDIAAHEAQRDSMRRRQDESRQRVDHRARANREMGGLALAVLEEQVANEATALALGLEGRKRSLVGERSSAESRRREAQRKNDGVGRLRQMLDEFDNRLKERSRILDSRLGSESPESLVDERDIITRQIKAAHGRGRGAIGFGVFLMILAAAGGAFLAFGQNLFELPPPVEPMHVQWGAIGAAALGLVLILAGIRVRRRGHSMAGTANVRLEDLDQQIARLMSEREVVTGRVLNVARDARAARINDDRIQSIIRDLGDSFRDFIERDVTVDDYASELRQGLDDSDRRMRHIDATGERLDHLHDSARALAGELEVLVPSMPAPTSLEDVDLGTLEDKLAQLKQRASDLSRRLVGDRRPVRERMSSLHEQVDRFGAAAAARLDDLDRMLAGPDKSAPGSERLLVSKVDALIAALPSDAELKAEVERAGASAEEFERKLAGLRTRLDERQKEMDRMKPQFDKRRTVEEEIHALTIKAEDLAREADRELAAARLLRGAADQLRSRLAPAIGRSLGKRLDHITGGRYSRVHVDLDFGINVYSDDRNAFVNPLELSGGTNDQLLLSLRLAFAEVLLATRGMAHGPHMLLLDEPLDGFDSSRARRFISLLREHSGPLSQVFLLASSEDVASWCDLTVRTTLEGSKVTSTGAISKHLTQPVASTELGARD